MPTITINGVPHTTKYKALSYEEILELAFPRPLHTVIYKHGPKTKPEGILSPKQCVALRDGMKIEVAFTGNA